MTEQTLKIARIYKDLDLSFTAHPVTGDVVKKFDVNAVKQAMQILVSTEFYERPFDPKKAGGLRGMLFEPMTSLSADVMARVIQNLFETYERRTRIDSVQVVPDYDNNSYGVTIFFHVIGIDAPQILSANLKRLR
jgi:phage baseplate assembly protein W